jgi:hypothetical protein
MPEKASRRGQVYFVGYAFDESLEVWWQPLQGEFNHGKQWEAEISFSQNLEIPQHAMTLIFRALSDPSIRMRFRLDNGQTLVCIIHSIEGFSSGSIRISSPDLGKP